MLITNKRFPILKMITDRELGVLGYSTSDAEYMKDMPYDIPAEWKKLSPDFNERIRLISDAFYNSFLMAKDKLHDPELFIATESQSGTLLCGTDTMCYKLVNKGNHLLIDFCFFDGTNHFNSLGFGIEYSTKYGVIYTNYHWHTSAYVEDYGLKEMCEELLLWLNFFKYAQVETKILNSNSKIKDVSVKIANQTTSKIEYVNSTWFTNLVKSEGFKVRGHFRLQPCGSGMKERKLIWIQDFTKTGYNAPARKLKEFAEADTQRPTEN